MCSRVLNKNNNCVWGKNVSNKNVCTKYIGPLSFYLLFDDFSALGRNKKKKNRLRKVGKYGRGKNRAPKRDGHGLFSVEVSV